MGGGGDWEGGGCEAMERGRDRRGMWTTKRSLLFGKGKLQRGSNQVSLVCNVVASKRSLNLMPWSLRQAILWDNPVVKQINIGDLMSDLIARPAA